MKNFTHLDKDGSLKMVDITEKESTLRIGKARGEIFLSYEIITKIKNNEISKGNVLEAARLAGIMASKKTSELIPLCHPLFITSSNIDFELKDDKIVIKCEVKNTGKTGVELVNLPLGTKIKLGPNALGEVTQIGKECHTPCIIHRTVGDCIMPGEGIFIKVVEKGIIKNGDKIEIIKI